MQNCPPPRIPRLGFGRSSWTENCLNAQLSEHPTADTISSDYLGISTTSEMFQQAMESFLRLPWHQASAQHQRCSSKPWNLSSDYLGISTTSEMFQQAMESFLRLPWHQHNIRDVPASHGIFPQTTLASAQHQRCSSKPWNLSSDYLGISTTSEMFQQAMESF